ncbi:bifunctional homocysteine S-methyltransferase/methylenetetrahydrofolate reductase [Gaopeijia maritima]|uniref:Bifunctional homocysteine S-methyltransferase/methylenetetrahydrofolate reductase n=1 Tax=Gaopeijia maritima TaxID=3119007 RepID=A0ABU9E9X9_9BACT
MSGGALRPHAHSPTLRELLDDDQVHVFDGAIGTLLYGRGVFVNVCYDALAVEEPERVSAIHREYVAAGAEVLETNTFGANPVKLSAFGLADRTEELNRAAARLAVEAADGRARVVGAVGPLGIRIEPWGPTSVEEARALFRRQMDALFEGGVDGLLLETFADPHEVEVALEAARASAGDRPVLVQITVGEDGRTAYGADAARELARLESLGADAVGLNCSVGPAVLLDVLEEAAERVRVPLLAQPNAGLPRTVRDRKMYMASPDYMARYARRFADVGVRFVGGCCGTTPEHVARIAHTVRGLHPRHASTSVRVGVEHAPHTPVPLAERSSLGAALAAGIPVKTVELLPPHGWNAGPMVEAARACAAAGVTAVTLVDSPRGPSRMATAAASTLVQRDAGIEAIMHYTCRDRNMMGMLSDLLGAAALGVDNLLLVSGDPPVQGPYPDATAVFDIDAIGLTNVAVGLNRGVDPGGAALSAPTRFVVAVAVNPGAVDQERERSRFRWKAEAGADVAITQPVFDVESLRRFLDATSAHPLPVLVGVWPFLSLRNAEFLAHEVPGVAVPESTLERMRVAQERGPDAARAEGIAIAREVRAEVESIPRVAGVHVSAPQGDVAAALAVLEDPAP